MNKPSTKFVLPAAVLFLCFVIAEDSFAQRGRGGGGRSSGHRAKNASRGANRSPAMSRPKSKPQSRPKSRPQSRPKSRPQSQQRPAGGRNLSENRPGGGTAKSRLPSGGVKRSGTGNRPKVGRTGASRSGGSRPSAANRSRPSKSSFTRPGGGSKRPGSASRGSGIARGNRKPDGVTRPRPGGSRPSSSQLNDFLGNRSPSRPGGATTLPGNVGKRPRPGGGDRPRPGGGDRPRPGDRDRPNLGDRDRPNLGDRDRPNLGDRDRPNLGDRDRPNLGDRDRPKVGNIGSRDVNVGNVNIGNSIDYSKDSKAWVSQRHNSGNRVRANASGRYANVYRDGRYRRGVGGGYPYHNGWGGRGSYYGWGAPTSVAVGAFLGAGWASATPEYYAYGTGGNVYYEGDTVIVNGQPAGTPEVYAQEAIDYLAAAPEPAATSEEDWMPLGVFAFTQEDVDDSQAMIEIAVNKQAVLAGTYYNEATDVSRPLKGTIDQESQRAVLGFADGQDTNIVLETGMFNLTKEEAPGLLHQGTEESSPVLLVRLEAPEE